MTEINNQVNKDQSHSFIFRLRYCNQTKGNVMYHCISKQTVLT